MSDLIPYGEQFKKIVDILVCSLKMLNIWLIQIATHCVEN